MQTTNIIQSPKPYSARSMYRIWQDAFIFYRRNFYELSIFCLIIVGLLALPHFLLPALNQYSIDGAFQLVQEHLLKYLVYGLISLYAINLLLKRTHDLMMQPSANALSWANTSSAVIKRFPASILGVIVISFFISLGYLIFFIGGGLVATLFSLYFPLLYYRNLSALDTFKQSSHLVSQHFLWTFCTLLIPNLIFIALSTLVFVFARKLPILHLQGQEIWVGHHLLRIVISALYFPYIVTLLFLILRKFLEDSQR